MSSDATKFSIFDKIKKNKKLQVAIFLIIATVFVLMIFLGGEKTESKTVVTTEESIVTSLENRLSNALSKVKGAGKVSVVITVESGMETVLAMKTVVEETQNGTVTETSPILVNGKTVELKQLFPKIRGVLIVAEGANSISVINKIQQATISLLDIDANQIEILTMK